MHKAYMQSPAHPSYRPWPGWSFLHASGEDLENVVLTDELGPAPLGLLLLVLLIPVTFFF